MEGAPPFGGAPDFLKGGKAGLGGKEGGRPRFFTAPSRPASR